MQELIRSFANGFAQPFRDAWQTVLWVGKQSKYFRCSSVGVVVAVLMIFSGLSTEDYVWAGFWFAAACAHVWIIIDEVRKINRRTR